MTVNAQQRGFYENAYGPFREPGRWLVVLVDVVCTGPTMIASPVESMRRYAALAARESVSEPWVHPGLPAGPSRVLRTILPRSAGRFEARPAHGGRIDYG